MSTKSTTERAAARSFHELGDALLALGRRVRIGAELIAIGRQLRRVTPADLEGDNLRSLRRPLDGLRASIEELGVITSDLRAVADALAAIVGVDN